MIIELLILVGGLLLLVKGSDYFVKSAGSLARNFGVSELVIGLTLIALGTSLPELVSGIFASLKHQSGLVMGNIIGANIANIGLVVGIAAIISVIKTKNEMIERDGYILLFSSLLLVVFLSNRTLSRIEGLILLSIYLGYTIFLIEEKPELKKKYHFKSFLKYFLKLGHFSYIKNKLYNNYKTNGKKNKLLEGAIVKNFLLLFLSGLAVIVGANYLVKEAVFFASALKVPQTIIGIIISIGTTMPEMSVAVTAARKGYGNITIGNALGSCITNLLLILGMAAVISPLAITNITLFNTVPFMILMIILLLWMIRSGWKITRKDGIILLMLYFGFLFFALSKAIL